MSDQVGRVGNNPGDLEEVKTLQLLLAHVAKLAIEVEKENGTGWRCIVQGSLLVFLLVSVKQ